MAARERTPAWRVQPDTADLRAARTDGRLKPGRVSMRNPSVATSNAADRPSSSNTSRDRARTRRPAHARSLVPSESVYPPRSGYVLISPTVEPRRVSWAMTSASSTRMASGSITPPGTRTVAPRHQPGPRARFPLWPGPSRVSSSEVAASASSRPCSRPPFMRSRRSARPWRRLGNHSGCPKRSVSAWLPALRNSAARTAWPRAIANGDCPIVGFPPSCVATSPSGTLWTAETCWPRSASSAPTARSGDAYRGRNRLGAVWPLVRGCQLNASAIFFR